MRVGHLNHSILYFPENKQDFELKRIASIALLFRKKMMRSLFCKKKNNESLKKS